MPSSVSSAGAVLLPGFPGTGLPDWIRRRLVDGLAGVCLFAGNLGSPEQVRALTTAIREANPRALVAVDEEGGDVTRLHAATGSPYPGNAWLGRRDDVPVTAAMARAVAEELRAAGVNLNLAPCLDVNSDADNPVIGVRSLGAEPGLVARHGAAWVRAHEQAGVATCVKHFPGHGDTATDSHLGLPSVDRDLAGLLARELVPFRAAVEAEASAVMTAHLVLPRVDPGVPATFSRALLGDVLRTRLGFGGVVVSDALDMAGAGGPRGLPVAAVRALSAGCDLLCLGAYTSEADLAAVESAMDALPAPRLDEAAGRVADLARRVRIAAPGPVPRPFALAPAEVARCFTVSEGARRQIDRAGGGWSLVRMSTTPDSATGPTPWGPFPLAEGPRHEAGPTTRSGDLPAGPVALVGRGNHRHPWVRSLVDGCRRERDDVLVVDMGWPAEGLRYADVATYGGSVLLGAGLLELLSR